jgi:hypothetical protein
MLVTLLHNTVDNRAEAIVTKCLESALDVQCAVVTCQWFSLLLPLTTALRIKRNLSKQNSVHNRRVRRRILSRVKKSETRDWRGNCLLTPALQNRVLHNEECPAKELAFCLAPFHLAKLNTATYFLFLYFLISTFHPPSNRFYLFIDLFTFLTICFSTNLVSFPRHYSLPYCRNYPSSNSFLRSSVPTLF